MTMQPARRTLLAMLAALMVPASRASAADDSAEAFVTALYARYKGPRAKGADLRSAASINRLFEPKLAMALVRDAKAAAAHGGIGTLDWDPFVDGHEFNISNVVVRAHELSSGRARAEVDFDNSGRPSGVTLDLVKLKQGWRVFDVTWANYKTLRALFQL